MFKRMLLLTVFCLLASLVVAIPAYSGTLGWVYDQSDLPFSASPEAVLSFNEESWCEVWDGSNLTFEGTAMCVSLPKKNHPEWYVVNVGSEDSHTTYIIEYMYYMTYSLGAVIRVDRSDGIDSTVFGAVVDGNRIVPERDGTIVLWSRETTLNNTVVFNVKAGEELVLPGYASEDLICYVFSPTSNPSALEYDLETWNTRESNCYSYALNFSPDVWVGLDSRVLRYSLNIFEHDSDGSVGFIGDELEQDMEMFTRTDYYTPAPDGYYKIAAFYGDHGYLVDTRPDIHFYREAPDGTWSHKLGATPAVCTDSEGEVIYNPQLASRWYSAWYNRFMGFFLVPNDLFCYDTFES